MLNGGKNKTLIERQFGQRAASFVLANVAAATGRKLLCSSLFWGLNVIKKNNKPYVKKDILEKCLTLCCRPAANNLDFQDEYVWHWQHYDASRL